MLADAENIVGDITVLDIPVAVRAVINAVVPEEVASAGQVGQTDIRISPEDAVLDGQMGDGEARTVVHNPGEETFAKGKAVVDAGFEIDRAGEPDFLKGDIAGAAAIYLGRKADAHELAAGGGGAEAQELDSCARRSQLEAGIAWIGSIGRVQEITRPDEGEAFGQSGAIGSIIGGAGFEV